jgi:hypothetical protein
MSSPVGAALVDPQQIFERSQRRVMVVARHIRAAGRDPARVQQQGADAAAAGHGAGRRGDARRQAENVEQLVIRLAAVGRDRDIEQRAVPRVAASRTRLLVVAGTEISYGALVESDDDQHAAVAVSRRGQQEWHPVLQPQVRTNKTAGGAALGVSPGARRVMGVVAEVGSDEGKLRRRGFPCQIASEMAVELIWLTCRADGHRAQRNYVSGAGGRVVNHGVEIDEGVVPIGVLIGDIGFDLLGAGGVRSLGKPGRIGCGSTGLRGMRAVGAAERVGNPEIAGRSLPMSSAYSRHCCAGRKRG